MPSLSYACVCVCVCLSHLDLIRNAKTPANYPLRLKPHANEQTHIITHTVLCEPINT